MSKILKFVDVVAIFQSGRTIEGVSYTYPETAKQVLYQVFDSGGKESCLVNLQLA